MTLGQVAEALVKLAAMNKNNVPAQYANVLSGPIRDLVDWLDDNYGDSWREAVQASPEYKKADLAVNFAKSVWNAIKI
jgi:hypothetical protein